MTFITPKTWAFGDVLSADDMNVYVRDNSNALNFGFRYVDRRVFDSAGTFTFTKSDPLGDQSLDGDLIRAYRIICVGGGGAGGGAPSTSLGQIAVASGGSSGQYAESFVLASDYGATVEVIVGAGGAGVSGNTGGAGGASSFDGAGITAGGGRGGARTTASSGVRSSTNTLRSSGTASGQITNAGEGGDGAFFDSNLAGTGASFIGGTGGSGVIGSGGPGLASTQTASLGDGGKFGGGGGGVSNVSGSVAESAATGRPGSDGVVIVELYA